MAKLRNIVVEGERYLWRFQPGYKPGEKPGDPYRCHDVFRALRERCPTSPLLVMFDTWDCPIAGGPLRCNAPIDPDDGTSARFNLHQPRWAAAMIRAGLQRGWQPRLPSSPCSIKDGVGFLKELAGTGGH